MYIAHTPALIRCEKTADRIHKSFVNTCFFSLSLSLIIYQFFDIRIRSCVLPSIPLFERTKTESLLLIYLSLVTHFVFHAVNREI
jgi:hypothetical protein